MNYPSARALCFSILLAGYATAVARAGSEWEFVAAPAPGDQFNGVFGVSGVAANDVWAVGSYGKSGDAPTHRTLAMHWDGWGWTVADTPNPSRIQDWNDLLSVVALSSDDVWAVGIYNPDSYGSQSLAEHFDGSSWTQMTSPYVQGGTAFFGIDAADGDSIWAVGSQSANQREAGLTARWNGSDWDLFDVEQVGKRRDRFYAVDVRTPDDVWAVGTQGDKLGEFKILIEHFDGSKWHAFKVPTPGWDDSLFGVVALAADDVWAVGEWYDPTVPGNQPLIMHYDGSSWSQTDLPTFPNGRAKLDGVAARSSTEVYAAGTDPDSDGVAYPLLMKYDGNNWSVMEPPPTDGSGEYFNSVAAIPGGDVWAVGQYYKDLSRPLTERHRARPPGDMNCDGVVDFNDIDPFVTALVSQQDYELQYPNCFYLNADINVDGSVDFNDIDPFVTCLVNGGCP